MNKRLIIIVTAMLAVCLGTQAQRTKKSQMRDSVALGNVTVVGKSRTQRLREGALAVNAIDVKSLAASISSLSGIVDRTTGVKIREEGGVGSDFDLSINGMSGDAIRFFIDGVPLDTKGSGVTLANLPVSLIDHVEIYKGVVPTWLSSDALGGAVNIVTTRKRNKYLDASYSIGSYHTHRADLNGQYVMKNGLTIRPTLVVNYSKNDYIVKEAQVFDEDEGLYLPKPRRRFHDGYRSVLGQLEAGFTGRSWADELFVSVSYNQVEKELQTNQVQDKVIGEAERESSAWGVGLRYQKNDLLLKGLSASLQLSHTWDHAITTDTAHRKYNWDGEWIASARNELNGRAFSRRHYKRPLTLGTANLNYEIPFQSSIINLQSFNLSYSLNRMGNDRWDDVDHTFEAANDLFAKHVVGLAYNQTLLGNRLYNTLFLKNYINHVEIRQTDLSSFTKSVENAGSHTQSSWGGGIGSKFQVWPQLTVKASYEHSVRLPLARELLGNGTTIWANTALKPEESNNLNVGLFGTLRTGQHQLYYEAGGFLRYVDNYIQPTISDDEGFLQYVNEPAVSIKGLEGELRYDYGQRLQVTANMSWQDARDNNRYKDDGKPSVTYKNHVPNRPWLFGSVDARYTFKELFGKTDRLILGADYGWVHWFYLSWEAYGLPATKARIPEKHLLGANATYSWADGRYNVSLDCRNLLDQTVYDNYKLQKPGRAVTLKFRLLFN